MTVAYPELLSLEKYLLFVLFSSLRIRDMALMTMHSDRSIIRKSKSGLPAFFYEEEMELLFAACEGTDQKSLRDNAILEMLYATGIRVSELTSIQMSDIDHYLALFLSWEKVRKERYIPFGSFAEEALYVYMEKSRPKLMKKKDHDMLFVNLRGNPY